MTIDKGIFIRNIYYMLTYAFQELKQNNYEEIAGEEFEEIHDLFAEILLRGISFQLKQGLHKEYISCHGSLSTLKGKLDICGTVNNSLPSLLTICRRFICFLFPVSRCCRYAGQCLLRTP